MPRFGYSPGSPGRGFDSPAAEPVPPTPPPPPTDAAGHVFVPARYRVNSDGTPMLTAAGTFRLKPGKKHA